MDGYRLSKSEWIFLKNVVNSWTLREVSRRSGLPFSTVQETYHRLLEKGRFVFMYKKRHLGLTQVLVLAKPRRPRYLPPFTMTIRRLYGRGLTLVSALLPLRYLRRYLDALAEGGFEPLDYVREVETYYWTPVGSSSMYDEEKQVLRAVFSEDLGDIRKGIEPPRAPEPEPKAPPKPVLAILVIKLKNPFLRGVYREYERKRVMTGTLPKLTPQALSRYVKWVRERVWSGNTFQLFLDFAEVPFRVYFFRGREAFLIARELVRIPGFFIANVSEESSIVFGQPMCRFLPNVLKMVERYDAEMPYGEQVMSTSNVVLEVPYLWSYVSERGVWTWPDWLVIPVKGGWLAGR